MIFLSPSILAADFTILGEQMKKAEAGGNDFFHFDVMDGMFVPNISFGIPVLTSVRSVTSKTLDVHLMVQDPERYVDKFIDAGADIITIHEEACRCVGDVIDHIHERKKHAGVAIKPGTDISVFRKYYGMSDMFLVMTVEPGFGGQTYMDLCTDKIRSLREDLTKEGYDTDIQVDGGITRENVDVVLSAGANVIVMGSSIFMGDITENTKYFKQLFSKKQ